MKTTSYFQLFSIADSNCLSIGIWLVETALNAYKLSDMQCFCNWCCHCHWNALFCHRLHFNDHRGFSSVVFDWQLTRPRT